MVIECNEARRGNTMISANTLSQVSNSFRRGYYDGYDGKPKVNQIGRHPFDRPFANFDYDEGYKAGINDRKWADKK
jgi:hypothetical protein